MQKQVDRNAYRFERYCGLDRWGSYWYQLETVLALAPESVVEVGAGDHVFGNYLRANTHVSYRSCDIAEDLHPDIVGSVDALPLPDASVDAVVAFEVLEHLPFERFEKALLELRRVARRAVVLSLPHYGPSIRFSFKIPFFGEKRFAWKIPHHPVHVWNGQHYWEIGKKGYELPVVISAIEKHFILERHFVPFENQYHHFFILKLKS
jgi:SAM-dependent methyltransferase